MRPRLAVNTGQAAIDAALAGVGIVRALSYQVAPLVAARKLQVVLASFEKDAVPVNLVQLPGLRTRFAEAFVELAAPRLRERLGGAPEPGVKACARPLTDWNMPRRGGRAGFERLPGHGEVESGSFGLPK